MNIIKSIAFTLAALAPLTAVAQTSDFAGGYASLDITGGTLTSYTATGVGAEAKDTKARLSLGYMVELGQLLIGPEVSLARSGYSGDSFSGTTQGTAIGLRAGYAMGRMMPYVGAHYGEGEIRESGTTSDTNTRTFSLGFEYALSRYVYGVLSMRRDEQQVKSSQNALKGNFIVLGLAYRF